MRIGLLFYSDTLVLSGTSQGILGRANANHGFVRALLERPRGHDVHLVVTSSAERDLIASEWPRQFSQNPPSVVTLPELPHFLQKNPLDVLHLLGPDLYRGLYLRDAIAQRPMAVTGVTHSLGHAPFLEWVYLNLLSRPRPSDRLICTSPTGNETVRGLQERALSRLAGFEPFETKVIPLGIDFMSFQGPAPSERARYGIPEKAVVLLSLGRLSQYTKTDLIPLLLAFRAALQKTRQDLRLVVAGATGQEDYVSILRASAGDYGVADRVIFVLNPDDREKYSLYQSCDVFVAPNDNPQETFGLSVVEAMASGLPVIASDWDGYRSLVREGKTGYLIPTVTLADSNSFDQAAPLQLDSLNHLYFSQTAATDLDLFSQRILELGEKEDLRKRLSEEARRHAKGFDWPVIIERYLELWAELADKARASPPAAALPTLDYHAAFQNNATGLLTPKSRFTRTSLGTATLKGEVPLRLYTAMEEILTPQLLQKLLLACDEAQTGEHLCRRFSEAGAKIVSFHLAWLCKYGLLSWDKPNNQ